MEKKMMSNLHLPPGFRFFPTDEELITHYLSRKASEKNFTSRAIADVVDLNKFEPWDLPGEASMGEKEWYFFSLRGRKYPTGLRTNRATRAGYWKTTGKDKEIASARHPVGVKKTLVFYKGRAPQGVKTNWLMHEYRLIESRHHSHQSAKEEWVVCRVLKKPSTAEKPHRSRSSLPEPHSETSLVENTEPRETDMIGSYPSSGSSLVEHSDVIPNFWHGGMNPISDLPVDYGGLLVKALGLRTNQAIRDELSAQILPFVNSTVNWSQLQDSSANVLQQQQQQPLIWSLFS